MVRTPGVSESLIGLYYLTVLLFTVFELGYLLSTYRNSALARKRKIKSTFLGWDKNSDETNYLWFRNLRFLLAFALISQGVALFIPVMDTLFEAFLVAIIMRFMIRVVSLNARYYDESTSAHYFGRSESSSRNSRRSTGEIPSILSCDRCLDLWFCSPFSLQTDAPFWLRLASVVGLLLWAVLRPVVFVSLVVTKVSRERERQLIQVTNYVGQAYLSGWCLSLFVYLLRVRYNSVEKYMFSLNTTVTHSYRNKYYFMRSIQRISRMVIFSLGFSVIFITRAVIVGAGIADETVKSSGLTARWHKLGVNELALLILAAVIVNLVLITVGLLSFLSVKKDGVSASLLYPSEARMEKEASDIANLTWKMSFQKLLPGEYDMLEPDTQNLRLLSGIQHEDDRAKAAGDDIDLLTAIGLQDFAGDLNSTSAKASNGRGPSPDSGAAKRTETEMHYLDVNRGYAAPSISSVKLSMSELSDSSFDPVRNAPVSPLKADVGMDRTLGTSSTGLTSKKTTMSESRSMFRDPFASLLAPKQKGSPNSSFRSEVSSASSGSKATTRSDTSISMSAAQRAVHPSQREKYPDSTVLMRAQTDLSVEVRKDLLRQQREDQSVDLPRSGTDRSGKSSAPAESPSGLRFERKGDRPTGKRMKKKLFQRRMDKSGPLPALNPVSTSNVSHSARSASASPGFIPPPPQPMMKTGGVSADSDMFAGLEFDRGFRGSEAPSISRSTASRRTDDSSAPPPTREHHDTATSVTFAGYPAGPPPAPVVPVGYMYRPSPTTMLKDRSGGMKTTDSRPATSTVPLQSVSPVPPTAAVSVPYARTVSGGASPSPGPPVTEAKRLILPQAKPITADFGAGMFPTTAPKTGPPTKKTSDMALAVGSPVLKVTPASQESIYDGGPALTKNFFELIDAKRSPVSDEAMESVASVALDAASPRSLDTPKMDYTHRQQSTATTLLSSEDESEWLDAVRRESGLQPTGSNPFKTLERDHLERLRELEEIEKRRGMSTATINQRESLMTMEPDLSESRDTVLPMIIAGQAVGIGEAEARRGLRTLSEHSQETSASGAPSVAASAWTTTTTSTD